MECKESSAELGHGSGGLEVECRDLSAELGLGSGGLTEERKFTSLHHTYPAFNPVLPTAHGLNISAARCDKNMWGS